MQPIHQEAKEVDRIVITSWVNLTLQIHQVNATGPSPEICGISIVAHNCERQSSLFWGVIEPITVVTASR
jgi:hypothetical protein